MTDTAQMVADLKATDDAINAKGWVAPGLGVPGAPLGLLNMAMNPLGGLAAAGLSWFIPMVSFLGDGLTQLQGGNSGSVSERSQDFDNAGQDIAGVADTYRTATSAQTSEWSGTAATQYRDASAQHAEGIAGLGEASNGVGSAIIGAGQVVAQAIAEVTQLIAEAVAEIVPIMTQAIARAGETFGQSVVEAIPPCVGIAVTYALRIAAKLAALVASGDNLMKLVQGGMAVVDLINTALSSISQQSTSTGAEPSGGTSGGNETGASAADTANRLAAADPGQATDAAGSGGGAPSASSSGGGLGGGPNIPAGGSTPSGSYTPSGSNIGTRSSSALPQIPSVQSGSLADASRFPGGGGGGSAAMPLSGGVQTGAVPLTPGARLDRGADSNRQENRQAVRGATKTGGTTPGAFPMGAMAGARPGDSDKDHERKYILPETHEELFDVAEIFDVSPETDTNEK